MKFSWYKDNIKQSIEGANRPDILEYKIDSETSKNTKDKIRSLVIPSMKKESGVKFELACENRNALRKN